MISTRLIMVPGAAPLSEVSMRPWTLEFWMVTLAARTMTSPLMSSPLMTVPALVIVRPPEGVRAVPAGTPRVDVSGVVVVGGVVGVVVGVGSGDFVGAGVDVLVGVGVGVAVGEA